MTDEAYSEIADKHLDALEQMDPSAYRDVITLCGLIFDHPERAQSMSAAITTDRGIVLRLTVPRSTTLRIFWTTHGADDGPRIEAAIEHR